MAKGKRSTVAIAADEEWKVESDLRTLTEAEAIRADAKRFAKVQALAKRKMLEAARVAGEAKPE